MKHCIKSLFEAIWNFGFLKGFPKFLTEIEFKLRALFNPNFNVNRPKQMNISRNVVRGD